MRFPARWNLSRLLRSALFLIPLALFPAPSSAQISVTITLASNSGGTYNYDINISSCC